MASQVRLMVLTLIFLLKPTLPMVTLASPLQNQSTGLSHEVDTTPMPFSTTSNMTQYFRNEDSGFSGLWVLNFVGDEETVFPDRENKTFSTVMEHTKNCSIQTYYFREVDRLSHKVKDNVLKHLKMIPLDLEVYLDGDEADPYHLNFTSFVKRKSESDFKFLPWRLEHFSVISSWLPEGELYQSTAEKVSRRFSHQVNLTSDCQPFVKTRFEDIAPGARRYLDDSLLERDLRDLIISHLIMIEYNVMNNVSKGNKDIFDKGNKDIFDEVCIVRRPGADRRGVPFELVECCYWSFRSVFSEDRYTKVICGVPDVTVYSIRLGTVIVCSVLFLFVPLLIKCGPSKPEPYKKLKKKNHHESHAEPPCLAEEEAFHHSHSSCPTPQSYRPPEEMELIQRNIETAEASKRQGNNNLNSYEGVAVRPSTGNILLHMVQELPSLVKEGVHFQTSIPDRLYLDSDPEFHLSMHITTSYMLLFHLEYRWLIILRRLVVLYVVWMMIGAMFFVDFIYFPLLLDVPIVNLQHHLFGLLYETIFREDDRHLIMYFMSFGMPLVMTILTVLFLFPLMIQKESIAKTLHGKGDLRFFGDPFPELLVPVRQLRRMPKPSMTVSHEMLLFENITSRIARLGKVQFWRLWWKHCVLKPLQCSKEGDMSVQRSKLPLIFLWLPVCILLLIVHVLPLTSIWANYMRSKWKEAILCSGGGVSPIRRFLRIPGLLLTGLGIVLLYLMVWDFIILYSQFGLFIFIDVLRNASATLPRIILACSLGMYVRAAFQGFEDQYRSIKEVTFAICKEFTEHAKGEEDLVEVVLINPPYEPLYIQTNDGEASIPRRVFYDICKAYQPYQTMVISTFGRLLSTFTVVTVIFLLIIQFQVFDEFSEVGETFLTICTVMLPSMFGILKSSSHQSLSNQRRDAHIQCWLRKITTVRPVNLLNKLDQRLIVT